MSLERLNSSKPIIELLIDAEVLFFYQYFAECLKVVVEAAANAPAAAVNASWR